MIYFNYIILDVCFKPDNVVRVMSLMQMCLQLGEWVYYASGSGRLPQPQDPVSITALAGSNNTLIIPFRNPLDQAVLLDVQMTGTTNCTLFL